MMLVADWKRIVRKAWSVRWIVSAALLSGIEVALTFADSTSDPRYVIFPLSGIAVPKGLFAALSFVATAGAFVARVMAQPVMHEQESGK